MNKEHIERANQINLAEYLLSEGEPLIREGGYYRHRDHDSLKFKDNLYYWNSRDDRGDAIKYLMSYQNMTFKMAVLSLIGANLVGEPITKVEQVFSWGEVKLAPNMQRVFAYLTKTRGIDGKIIKRLVDNQLLFQEADTNNALFPILDEQRQIVGAEAIGTLTGKRFKGIKNGSKYGYGYNVPMGEEIRYLMFFESAVDLLSFIEVEQLKAKPIDSCRLVSLAGLKEPIFSGSLERQKQPFQPVLCVDNDSAGDGFIKAVRGKYEGVRVFRPDVKYKDWNDQLQAMKGKNDQ
jgi:hypothetical protein